MPQRAAESVAPGVWKILVGAPEPHVPSGLREIPPEMRALAAMTPAGNCPVPAGGVLFRTSARGCVVEVPIVEGEDFYGLGLQLKSVRQTGRKKTLRVNSDPISDLGDSHAPVPFLVSTRGWAILVDTLRYASFYAGTHTPLRATAAAPAEAGAGLAGSTEELYRARPGGARRLVVEVPAASGVDLYVFGGPTMLEAVRRYALFSGGGCLPPMWGLGVWYRCCGKSTQDEALALARSLREARMPCDVFGLEPGWQSHAYSCSLVWSAERFGDPDRLLAELGGMGFRTNLWEHAFVHPDSPLYETARFRAGDEEVWGGAVPDLALPEMREAFARHHDRTLVSRGVSGFKLDECDNSDFIGSPWSFPEYSRFPSGLDGEQMHSAFGILYQQTMLDPFRGRDIRTYGQVRSSGAFAAPYPYVLYSDLYDHRDFLRGVVNCGFSCLLWSPEVREARSVDELVRRLQAVVFSPQALLNAWYMQHPPWRQIEAKKNADGEFMPEWRAVEDRCRLILQMRMRLVPYLYAAFAQYRFAGKPPFRALVLDWPDDPACRDLGDQYMMGDDLLVAPIPADAEGRAVYLPAGAWYDLATGLRREGGATIDVPAGAAEIPVFVRGGAILPLAEPVDFVAADTVFRIEALTHGEPSRPCVLFEDDGESWAFESGACNRVELRWDPVRGPEVRREGSWPGRRYEVVSWTHRR